MKKNTYLIFIALSLMLVAVSCSKAAKLENNLTKQGGRWNIDNYKVTIATTELAPVITESGDAGYMYFFDNFDGHWIDLSNPDEDQFLEFEWEITPENTLILRYNNEEFILTKEELTMT